MNKRFFTLIYIHGTWVTVVEQNGLVFLLIFIGQSNMDGRAPDEDLPGYLKVPITNTHITNINNENIGNIRYDLNDSFVEDKHGLLVPFADAMKELIEGHYAFYAQGGTNLFGSWGYPGNLDRDFAAGSMVNNSGFLSLDLSAWAQASNYIVGDYIRFDLNENLEGFHRVTSISGSIYTFATTWVAGYSSQTVRLLHSAMRLPFFRKLKAILLNLLAQGKTIDETWLYFDQGEAEAALSDPGAGKNTYVAQWSGNADRLIDDTRLFCRTVLQDQTFQITGAITKKVSSHLSGIGYPSTADMMDESDEWLANDSKDWMKFVIDDSTYKIPTDYFSDDNLHLNSAGFIKKGLEAAQIIIDNSPILNS